ncbi:hypothetical protein CMI47_18175 [Candidatus Pacearchaeota archaeon]|nr:hypothetical protein [Candidatus Pacearchaeota archaeon]|tara:strand:- start:943 stop:1206 length:264 start_codon:yes stop_codon:yes gene_type:complete
MIFRFLFAASCEVEADSIEEARSKYADASVDGDDSTWEYDLEHQIIESIKIGHWPCEASPHKVCAYDDVEDPMHDNCLYCEDPEERK